jgi:hypothetical protein
LEASQLTAGINPGQWLFYHSRLGGLSGLSGLGVREDFFEAARHGLLHQPYLPERFVDLAVNESIGLLQAVLYLGDLLLQPSQLGVQVITHLFSSCFSTHFQGGILP